MKKVVVLGGGTGTSTLLEGLKEFPIDITTIISVSDNGKSTGKLREEIKMPAIGDLRKVLLTLSQDNELKNILNYRLKTDGPLDNHSIGNLLMTGIYQLKNNDLVETVNTMRRLFNIKSLVFPVSEDNLTLISKTVNDNIIVGQKEIMDNKEIKDIIYYDKEPKVVREALLALETADLIIISAGSLFTSILPTLIPNEIKDILKKKFCKTIYICNMVTQPGETTSLKASDHVKTINKHVGANIIDTIILNKKQIDNDLISKYTSMEQKELVINDYDELNKLDLEIIEEDLLDITNEYIRHDSNLLAFVIYSYLMRR